jgi:prohibitin 1
MSLLTRFMFGIGAGVFTGLSGIRTVPPNHVAYTNTFGNVGTQKKMPGINIVNPFASLISIPLLTNNFSSEIEVSSNEGLSLTVQVDTIYAICENDARDVYLKFRFNYEKILIKPLIESILRNIMANYETKALYSEKTRHEIQEQMRKEIINKMNANGITVNDVLINKIKLPLQVQNAIENKLRVEQENEQMVFTIEKQRKEMSFKLEREKMEAQRKQIEAEGIQRFQQTVSQGISDKLLQWKGIEATNVLASSPNAKVVVIGNTKDGLPLILGGN